jgi:hypothetical protein
MQPSDLIFVAAFCSLCAAGVARAQQPNHPIVTEVYFDPPGLNDGPVGRDPANQHQEFIEIYLPPLASLSPALNKDALRITYYEVEGDSDSTGPSLVNCRFDLPTFDLDPSNGMTAGAIPRPSSGVVVLGWVDYVGNPPTSLAGTPSTRVALINGGITSTGGAYTFIAVNGHHFGGTTNFPVLTAESFIDLPGEASSGTIQNGSSVYMLVNRDSAGYVQLCDDQHAGDCAAGANPTLPDNGTSLTSAALLDGLAGNDHSLFVVTDQPYDAPTGDDIDLEAELPLGGAFSLLVAQVPEVDTTRLTAGVAGGYARFYTDVPKTTETGAADDPAIDAQNAYRHVRNDGPFFPSPGKAALTTSPPELAVASGPEQAFDVLSGTTGRPGILSANVGGDYAIDMAVTGATSDDPSRLTLAAASPAADVAGQALGFPQAALTPTALAGHGDVITGSVTVTAANSQGGDPAVVSPVWTADVTATVLNPVNGQDENGQPLQATVFAAIQGIVAQPVVANEFLATDLGTYVGGLPDPNAIAGLGHAELLTTPTTNIGDPLVIQPLIEDFPDLCCDYINPAGAPGTANLLQTILNSAEVQSGAGTYDDAVATCACPAGTQTAVRAISVNHPDVFVYDGPFTPSETLHFVEPGGFVGDVRSGMTNATSTRTFELALLDTNVTAGGTLETGATDDFGVVVEVALVEPGALVDEGELVFLSFMGGLQGADFDTLEVPPGNLIGVIIYFDLDNLHDVLGVRSIERVILVDGSGSGQTDIIEAFCLNATEPSGCTTSSECNDNLFCTGTETCQAGTCVSTGNPCTGGLICSEGEDACIAAPACPGGTTAECADLDDNGVRDDNCLWWECVGGACEATQIPFADMGGAFGGCPPDVTADGNDRFHALNCFANTNTAGNTGYPCEPNPPQAFNVDAGGQFGSCLPDGVCDGNDAFAALNAFSGTSTCSCPLGGPAPNHDPTVAPLIGGRARLVLQASSGRVHPGEVVHVEVYLDDPLPDLRGYQLHLSATGGTRGRLDLVDIGIAKRGVLDDTAASDRTDADFTDRSRGMAPFWSAFNQEIGQMVVGLDGPGLSVSAGSYLATFTYRASEDAQGRFTVELLHDPSDPAQRTFLFPTPAQGRIELTAAAPAVIDVQPASKRRDRATKPRPGS